MMSGRFYHLRVIPDLLVQQDQQAQQVVKDQQATPDHKVQQVIPEQQAQRVQPDQLVLLVVQQVSIRQQWQVDH